MLRSQCMLELRRPGCPADGYLGNSSAACSVPPFSITTNRVRLIVRRCSRVSVHREPQASRISHTQVVTRASRVSGGVRETHEECHDQRPAVTGLVQQQ